MSNYKDIDFGSYMLYNKRDYATAYKENIVFKTISIKLI